MLDRTASNGGEKSNCSDPEMFRGGRCVGEIIEKQFNMNDEKSFLNFSEIIVLEGVNMGRLGFDPARDPSGWI
jgi:hypothetical protein